MRAPLSFVGAAVAVALILPGPAAADVRPHVAGVQAALRAKGLYRGPIDGIAGPQTERAVRAFQRRARLTVDGVAGPRTRRALGVLGRPVYGRRTIVRGMVGFDVSVLQFQLVRRGFRSVAVDGRFGAATESALRRFQRANGLAADGIAGRATFAALAGRRRSARRAGAGNAAGIRYVVRPGDTLSGIATRYGVTLGALARANRLNAARVLLVATRLRIPRRTAAVAPAMGQPWTVRVLLDHWARRYGVDPRLVRALAWMESGYQNHVVSPVGAFGVMQVTPATWAFVEDVLLGRKVPRTVAGNIRVGVAFLDHLLHVFRGNERLALAAYYQGPHSVMTRGLLRVTKAYVADVLALKRRV